MSHRSFGHWIAAGFAGASLLLSGCHNAADNTGIDPAQKAAILGGKPTADQLQRAEQARLAAAQASSRGAAQAGQQAAAQGKPAPK